jgi:hypothetical protein
VIPVTGLPPEVRHLVEEGERQVREAEAVRAP